MSGDTPQKHAPKSAESMDVRLAKAETEVERLKQALDNISIWCSTRKDIDVGAVARNQGGGGHKGAAGFQLKQLPPELMP
jgi:nanoRNase/pAp phosphatase (c-di-AMP/oligoRNAs hydrolase)